MTIDEFYEFCLHLLNVAPGLGVLSKGEDGKSFSFLPRGEFEHRLFWQAFLVKMYMYGPEKFRFTVDRDGYTVHVRPRDPFKNENREGS